MLGVGPQWAHLKQNGKTTDSFSAELAGDFMFWPTGTHRFGWYLEPAYEQFRWRPSAVDRDVGWPAHRRPLNVRGYGG
jgi:hypothetical protein